MIFYFSGMSLESRLQDLDYDLGRTFYKIKKSKNPLLLYETIPTYAKLIGGTTKDALIDSYNNIKDSSKERKKRQKNMTIKEKLKDNLVHSGKSVLNGTKKIAKKTIDTIISPQILGIVAGLTAVNNKFYLNASKNLPFNATLNNFGDYLMFLPKVAGNVGYSVVKNTYGFLSNTLSSAINFSGEQFMNGLEKLSYLAGLDKEMLKDISFAATKQMGELIYDATPFIIGGSILALASYYGIKRFSDKRKLRKELIEENNAKPKSKKINEEKLEERIKRETKKKFPSVTTDFLKSINKSALTYAGTIALIGKAAELYNHYTGYLKTGNKVINLGLAVSDAYYGFMSKALVGVKYFFDYFTNKGLPDTLGMIGGDALGNASYVLDEIGKDGGQQLLTGGVALGLIGLGFWGASKYNHFKDKASQAEINRIDKKYKNKK